MFPSNIAPYLFAFCGLFEMKTHDYGKISYPKTKRKAGDKTYRGRFIHMFKSSELKHQRTT